MAEILTRQEIEEKYPSEWVLVVDPEVDENENVVRGTVAFHSRDRDEMYRQLVEMRPKSSATLYTGRLSHDAVVIL